MAEITLESISIPTPTAYSAEDPLKNLGDLSYVVLQILSQMKSAGMTISDNTNLLETLEAIGARSVSFSARGLTLTATGEALIVEEG